MAETGGGGGGKEHACHDHTASANRYQPSLAYTTYGYGNAPEPVCILTNTHARLTIDVEHHVPHGRTDGLVEAEPHLPASAQGVVVALWGGEEGAAHWGVPGGRETCRGPKLDDTASQSRCPNGPSGTSIHHWLTNFWA